MQRGNYNWNYNDTNDEVEELRRRLQRSNNTSSSNNNRTSSTSSSTSNTTTTRTYLPATVVGMEIWGASWVAAAELASEETTTTTTTHYCPHSSCYQTVSYSGDYCSQHQSYCQESSCYSRIPSYESYCDSHKSSSYQAPSYSTTTTYYSTPSTRYCGASGCCSSISYSESYCYSHQNSYCASCSTQIPRGQTYCYSHANGCYSCGQRIGQGQNYCYQHANQCSHCSTRISSGQSICPNHQNRSCYSCGTTIPFSDTYCYSHKNACRSCSQRIAYGQSHCYLHLDSCQTCATRIPSRQAYCYQHTSQCSYCSTRISSEQSACPSHQNRSCLSCEATISYSSNYCNNHKNACQECSQRIPSGQSYCYYHLDACLTCSIRIPSAEVYCPEHFSHKCKEPTCLNKIDVSQPYCYSHKLRCKETNCQARIPGYLFGDMWSFFRDRSQDRGYCVAHQGICEDLSCLKRTSNERKYCSLHEVLQSELTELLSKIGSSEVRTHETCQGHQNQLTALMRRRGASNPEIEKSQKKLTDYLNAFTDLEELLKVIQEATNPEELNETLIWYNSWVELTKKSKAKRKAYKALYEPIGEVLEQAKRKNEQWENAKQKHKCQEQTCEKQIPLTKDYCNEHIMSCQEVTCSTRIPSTQNYCSFHKKQTLQKWWEEGKITELEKDKLNEFNLNKKYTLKQLKEILEEDTYINDSPIISNTITGYIDPPVVIEDNLSKSLKRVRPKLALVVAEETGDPPGSFVEVIPFSTWFNKDCATVISKLDWTKLFDVWMTVCEKPVRKIQGLMDIIWDSEHPNISTARGRAAYIRKKINEDRPVLCICPSLQVFYRNDDYLFVNIIKVYLPTTGDITNNPGEYLLPFDIIERSSGGIIGSGGKYRHVAIYLGRDPKGNGKKAKEHKVCHVYDPGPPRSEMASTGSSAAGGTTVGGSASGSGTLSSASASEKKKAKARIDSWDEFLGEEENLKELIRYRITIPFKEYEKQIEQIAKAVVTEFGKGSYHAVDRNCEHFAFAIACGVNFSEQEQTNRDKLYRKFLYRRGSWGSKISQIDLEREMNKNDELFDNLVPGSIEEIRNNSEGSATNREVADKFDKINQWSEDKNLFISPLQEQNYRTEIRVIIPPKYHNWK